MRMNRIGLKLGAVIISLFLVVLLILGMVVDRVFTTFYHAKMQEEVEELSAHFANMVMQHDESAEDMIQTFAEFSNVGIYLVDETGTRMENLGKLAGPKPSFITQEDIRRLFAGQAVFKEFETEEGERYYVSARPVMEGEHAESALYVLSSMADMEESMGRVRTLIALSGVGAFFLALGFTYIVTQLLSRPMIQMERATRSIAKGQLETRLAVRSSDEIGTLAAAINDLAKDLQHYRDTRQEFFANISHELRTPVTYLEGYARVLNDGLYDTEEERKLYLSIIHQESMRLNRLIYDLFELSKMEEGKVELNREWVDVRELVDQCVSKAQLKIKEKGLAVEVRLPEAVPPLYMDGLRLEQVIQNLLDNAVRYTEQGSIGVSLTEEAQHLRIVVADTGIGIPQEELPFIFDRFYRVEKSRSREFGGTGLGLAIARKLVELQGGTVEVRSRGAGAGTEFTVLLPKQSDISRHPEGR